MDSKKEKKAHPKVADRFASIFGVHYVHATYYDARRRLVIMAQEDIDRSVAALHTDAGLWSLLAQDVPLRK